MVMKTDNAIIKVADNAIKVITLPLGFSKKVVFS